MAISLSPAEVEAGLAYTRWLHRKLFNDMLNASRREVGLPTQPATVCLNEVGRRVFERLARDTRNPGVIRTVDGDLKAVVSALVHMKAEGAR